jgi:AcrR family transcriptional regulator
MTVADRQARPAKGRPTGAGLSREQVLEAAMEILESVGIERLTVRALAAKLGVAVTAIYWHVGNKQALFDGLVERIIAQIGQIRVRGQGPEVRILSIGHSLRHTLLERPNVVAVVHRQGRTAALFQPARRVLVRELTALGLPAAETAVAVGAILNLIVGSVLVDRQVERQPAQQATPEELWTPDDVPDNPDLLRYLSQPVDQQELFDYSLRVLVRAVVSGV